MNEIVEVNGHFVGIHPVAAKELEKLRTRVAELEAAITWALGVGECFPDRPEGKGAFWWRSELQKRAGLKWDGKKFISQED